MYYHEILGVKKNATQEEIETACKELILEYHPNVLNREKKFKRFYEAYKVFHEEAEIEEDSPSYLIFFDKIMLSFSSQQGISEEKKKN